MFHKVGVKGCSAVWVCVWWRVAGAPNQALARTQLVKSPWAGTNIKNSSLAANNRHQKGSEN